MKARKLLALIPILLLITAGCFGYDPDDIEPGVAEDAAEEQEGQAGALGEDASANVSWEGEWTIWIVIDQPYQLTMSLSQSSDLISGTSTADDGETVTTINGVLDADFASGTWVDDEGFAGIFEWRQINANQFIGYWQQTDTPDGPVGEGETDPFAWCGARNGATQPDPCLGP